MARGLLNSELEREWQDLPKNWYAIYQWKRTSGASYSEWIAEHILDTFQDITLVSDGLRSRTFRVPNHRGQISLNTGIEQITEKRLVRAMFNLGQLPSLGSVIDYEVPLKNTEAAAHGDIDLLCRLDDTCLCVEAKKPNAAESILKAILQTYAYTSLVASKKDVFFDSFGFSSTVALCPAVLTFASAVSGQQLSKVDDYPYLQKLITALNERLDVLGVHPIRFFVIENPDKELATCLTTATASNGDVKAVFCDSFKLFINEHYRCR